MNVIKKIKNVDLVLAAKKEGLYTDIEKIVNRVDNIDFLGTIPYDQVIPVTLKCHCIICNPFD